MDLLTLGWRDDFYQEKFDLERIARITGVYRGLFHGMTKNGAIHCYLSGKYQYENPEETIAVGDWCLLQPTFLNEQNHPSALIEKILLRRSKISRVSSGRENKEQFIASNVDFAFIVTSANEDLNFNRIHRYILLTQKGNVTPILVLSKIDLKENYETTLEELQSKFKGIEVLGVSADKRVGLESLSACLSRPGVTGVFLGSSGVGKSTLINNLLGSETQKTQGVRTTDDKGRHTTTTRELFFLPHGGMVIDTPGLRELQVFGDDQSLRSTFGRIEELIQKCRFTNCTHTNEPDCALLEALAKGDLDQQEMASYQKLLKEVEYSNRKMDRRFASNQKRKWKTISKAMRNQKKLRNR